MWFLNETIVITAAHCLFVEPYVYLVFGTLKIDGNIDNEKTILIHDHQFELPKDYIHENYVDHDGQIRGGTSDDIAKIQLNKVPDFHPKFPTIAKSDHKLTKNNSEILTIYGYGEDVLPVQLKHCKVKYISGISAKADQYKRIAFDENETICTWPVKEGGNYEHALDGDSGAPCLNADGEVVAILTGGNPGLSDIMEPTAQHYGFIHRKFKSNPYPKQPDSSPEHSPVLSPVSDRKHRKDSPLSEDEHLKKIKKKQNQVKQKNKYID